VTYQLKAALVIGFSLCLLVGIVVADHFSAARHDALQDVAREAAPVMPAMEPRARAHAPIDVPDEPFGGSATTEAPLPAPVVIANGPTAAALAAGTSSDRATAGGDRGLLSEMLERGAGVRALMETRPRVSSEPEGRGATVERRVAERSEAVGGVRTVASATYRVRPGDSLYAIAKRVLGDGNRWRELRALNERVVGPNGELSVGTVLRLPASAGGSRPSGSGGGAEPRPSRDRRYYVVKPGDTLSVIAQRELGTVRKQGELLKVNASRIRSADEIYVGMKLELPL